MEVYDLSNNLLLFSGLHYKKSFKIQNNNFIIYTKVSEEQISGPKAPEPGQIKVKYTFRKNILDINNNVINQADDEIEVISGHIRN
jgi:predicted nucleic-acid-binding Zn-ribbon protein